MADLEEEIQCIDLMDLFLWTNHFQSTRNLKNNSNLEEI